MQKQNEMESVLNDQVGGNLATDSYELVKRSNVAVFEVVECEKGFFIAIGQHRLTNYVESFDVCVEMIDKKSWELLLSVLTLVVNLKK